MASRTISARSMASVPAREFRLLIEGLKTWTDAIAAGSPSPPLVGIVEGEPGRGAYTLLSALRSVAPDLGLRFLSAAFSAQAHGCAAPILDLLAPLVARAIGGAEADTCRKDAFLSRFGPDLRGLLPELCWPREVEEPPAGDTSGDRRRRIDAAVLGLVEQVRRTPAVIVFHDTAYADAFGREVLRHLVRILRRRGAGRPGLRVFLILSGEVASAAALPEFYEARQLAFHVRTRGFSREDIQDLARSRFDEALSVTLREKLIRLARGDIRFVNRFFRRAARKGAGSAAANALLLDASTSLVDLVTEDYHELDAMRRQVVFLLSVLGFAVECGTIDAWVRRFGVGGADLEGPGSLGETLRGLETDGWVLSSGVGEDPEALLWSVETDIARMVLEVADASTIARVREQAAAVVFEGCRGLGRGAVRAFYLLVGSQAAAVSGVSTSRSECARPPAEECEIAATLGILEIGDVAAQYLEGIGGADAAIEVLEELLRSRSDLSRETTLELERRVARLLAETDHYREAIELLERGLSDLKTASQKAAIWRQIGDLRGKLGDQEGRLESYREGQRLVHGDEANGESVLLLVSEAECRVERGELALGKELCAEASARIEAAGSADESALRRVLCLRKAILEQERDLDGALAVEERLYESYVRGDDKDRTIRSLLDLGDLLSRKAEPQRAEACLCKALQVADETGARFCMAEVLCRLGQLRRERRDFAEALRCLGSARAIFGEFADEVGLERVESSLYDYELRTGRFDEAAETLTRCLERRFGCATEWPARADGSVDGVRAVAAERESVRRRERQEELENGLEAGGIRLPAMEVLELVEIWRKSGNIERAFRLLESSLGNEEFKARAETRALATEALGRLALVRGDVELALKSFEQSLNPRSGPPSQDRVATAYLEVGGVLLLRGRLARALDYTLKGLRLALARGSVESCLDGLLALGDLLFEVGEDRAAGRIGAAAANLARSRGAFDRELVAVCQAGRSLRRTGADGPARRAFLRAWEIDRAIAAPLERCRYALEDGWEHFVRGDMARAASAASAGVELARAIGAQRYVPDFWHLAGVVEGCSRNPHNNLLRALELLERVHQDAEANGRPRLAWEVSLAIALIYAGRGKSEIAEAYRQRAEKSRVLCFASLPAELSGLCWSTRHRAEDFS